MAPILIVGGLLLAIVGWSDVLLLYYPLRLGNSDWEFGVIGRTFEALPLPTLGLLLFALGLRAGNASTRWTRGLAVVLAVVALFTLAALTIFALDVPLAIKTMQRAGASQNPQGALVSSGIKRVMAKTIVFSLCYAAAYTWLALKMWRTPRVVWHDVDSAQGL